MATRRILLIDNDLSFFSQLTQLFSPYQILVQQAEPSEESLSLALEQEAVLVFIAVNLPEKLGFSLCHKAKKILRVPVVLNTVTIPPEGFDKHRRLRSRADGYLDKRSTSPEQILAVVGSLIELGSPVESEDSPDLEMPFGNSPLDLSEQFAPEERTAVATTAFLDEEIAEETDAAFAIMAMGEDSTKKAAGAMYPSSANPASTILDLATASPNETLQGHGFDDAASREPPNAPTPAIEEESQRSAQEQSNAVPGEADVAQLASDDSDEFELDISTVVSIDNVDGDSTALTNIGTKEGVTPRPRPSEEGLHAPEAPTSIAVELGLDTVAASAAQEEAETITPKELAELRSENAQLKENASKSPSSDNSFSREHEFLALRERINKKEKALLDSQDLLTSKDRRILDLSDELRGLERKGADLDENILDLEQRNLKKKEDLAAAEQSLQALRDTLSKNEETYTAALAAKEVAHKTEAESREKKHSTEVAELEEKHRATLNSARATMAQAQRESEATLLALSEQAALAADEHLKTAVAKAQKDGQDDLTAAKSDHEQRETSLRSEKADELEAAKKQFDDDLAQTLEKHASKLEALTAEASAEKERALATASAEYKAQVEALKSSHEAQVAKLAEQRAASEKEASLTQEVSNEAHEKVRREMETRAKDLEIALSSSRNTLSEREEQLLGLRALITEGNSALAAKVEELATRNTLVGSLEHEKEELMQKNLSYEQQVLAAYKKIKSDEATMSKATKALAIALTLLDEPQSPTPPEKATASCDNPPQDNPPQDNPPQQP